MTSRLAKAALTAAALALLAAAAPAAEEKPVELHSGPAKVRLLELFTSQSRSSCPPAGRWLSSLRDDPALWSEIVPVAFHVDYWDKRGWKDRLASPAYTDRMQSYLARWQSSTPFAPLVALDGTEWSGWAREERFPDATTLPAGTLTLKKISENEYRALYVPEETARGPWIVHGVLLGFGVETRIEAGENIGRTLREDFTALRDDHKPMESTRDGFRATLRLPVKGTSSARDGLALAAWVTRGDDILPVQAIGFPLPGYKKNPSKRT